MRGWILRGGVDNDTTAFVKLNKFTKKLNEFTKSEMNLQKVK